MISIAASPRGPAKLIVLLVVCLAPWTAQAGAQPTFNGLDGSAWAGESVAAAFSSEGMRIAQGSSSLTSKQTFNFGTLKTRLRVAEAKQGVVYFGFFSREPWAHESVWIMGDHGEFRLQVRRNGGSIDDKSLGQRLGDGQWHDVQLTWTNDIVEVVVDGTLMATVDGAPHIPQGKLPMVFDLNATGPTQVEVSAFVVGPATLSADTSTVISENGIDEPFDSYSREVWTDTNAPGLTQTTDGILVVKPDPNSGANIVSSLDRFTSGTLETRVRFHGVQSPKSTFYIGFFDTQRWAYDTAWGMVQDGQMRMQARHNSGTVHESIVGPRLEDNRWYTLKIVWTKTSAELIVDDKSYGTVTDPSVVPAAPIAVVFHVVSSEKELPWIDVDWAKVDGELVRGPRPVRRSPLPPKLNVIDRPANGAATVDLPHAATSATISNPHYKLKLDWDKGLRISELSHSKVGPIVKQGATSQILSVQFGSDRLTGKDFSVTNARAASDGDAQTLTLDLQSQTRPTLKGELQIIADQSHELRWRLALNNSGRADAKLLVTFPIIENVQIGEKIEDNYYFYPYHTGWAGNTPATLKAEYGAIAWTQLLSVFNPSAGATVYLYPIDSSGAMKTIMLRKTVPGVLEYVLHELMPFNKPQELFERSRTEAGVDLGIGYLEYVLKPGQKWQLPDACVGVDTGDFKPGLFSYRDWLATWFKHRELPQWYLEQFSHCSAHDNEAGFWSLKDQRYVLSEHLTGWEDTSEWALWWSYPEANREGGWGTGIWKKFNFGDYDYPEHRGGLEPLRKEIAAVQAQGTLVRLYMEVTMLWKGSRLGAAHGKEWARMDMPGQYNMDFASGPDDGYSACGQVHGWQDAVAAMCAKWVRDLGVASVRLDRGNNMFACFNSEHEHYDGTVYSAVRPEEFAALFTKTLAAMQKENPEAVIMGEHAGSDYLAQFSDGSTDQALQFPGPKAALRGLGAYQLSFFRFLMPEHRLYTWGYHGPDGERHVFFNGIGMESRREAVAGRTQRETTMALASKHPEPFVATHGDDIYANYFPADSMRVYMVYNRSNNDYQGPMVDIDLPAGWRAVELCEDQPAAVTADSGQMTLSHSIDAGQVLCVALFPVTLNGRIQDGKLAVDLKAADTESRIEVYSENDASEPVLTKEIGREAQTIVAPLNGDATKYIVKRMQGRMLLDQQVVTVR